MLLLAGSFASGCSHHSAPHGSSAGLLAVGGQHHGAKWWVQRPVSAEVEFPASKFGRVEEVQDQEPHLP